MKKGKPADMPRKIMLEGEWRLFHHAGRQYPLPPNIQIPLRGITATVPGTVHTDLLAAGIIEDPFYGDNELKVRWIDDQEWLYKTRFQVPEDWDKNKPLQLVFDGLDTAAQIMLNGKMVGRTNNMFRPYRFTVDAMFEKENELAVLFYPARRYGLKNSTGIRQFPSTRHPERAFIRKAQYSFGWDWGPALPSAGIWKGVCLEQDYENRITGVHFETTNLSDAQATVKITVRLSLEGTFKGTVHGLLEDQSGRFENTVAVDSRQTCEWECKVPDPELWWPAGQGNPYLYNLEVTLADASGHPQDIVRKKVGIRTVRLIREEDGKPCFRFSINDRPIFLKGANWIPADSFLPGISEQKYRDLLTMARDGRMNILRVWGGGIYEQDCFYTICDELGLLVWQDFMFACAAYPDDEAFIENIREEIRFNVLRLQAHPCLLIWCGNNENEWICYRDHCGPVKEMPGFRLFHEVFPELLQQLDPSRPYWPSSPFGDDTDPNDPGSGNRHVWHIWSYWNDYTEVTHDRSHFVTEFGFQGPANFHTLKDCLPEQALRPQHPLFEFHNKQEEGTERLFRFLSAHLPVRTEPGAFIYLTQLNQGLALKTCLEHWRLRWPETAGSIIWQLNDCWPVTSWSLIDSMLRPKPAYYFVQNAFAPLLVAFRETEGEIQCLVDNQSPLKFSGMVRLYRLDFKDGRAAEKGAFAIDVECGGRKTVTRLEIDPAFKKGEAIWYAELQDTDQKTVSWNVLSMVRLKHLPLQPASVGLSMEEDEEGFIFHLKSDRTALFVTLEHPHLTFTSNGFFLFPRKGKTVRAYSRDPQPVKVEEILCHTLNNFCGG